MFPFWISIIGLSGFASFGLAANEKSCESDTSSVLMQLPPKETSQVSKYARKRDHFVP